MPGIDRQIIYDVQDLLDLLADLFQGLTGLPSRVN